MLPPKVLREVDTVNFVITKPSLFRVFARVPTGADVDFFIYRIENGTQTELAAFALASDDQVY